MLRDPLLTEKGGSGVERIFFFGPKQASIEGPDQNE